MMIRSILRNLVGGAGHVDNIGDRQFNDFRLASQEKLIL